MPGYSDIIIALESAGASGHELTGFISLDLHEDVYVCMYVNL